MDGSVPSFGSPTYSAPFTLDAAATVQAIATGLYHQPSRQRRLQTANCFGNLPRHRDPDGSSQWLLGAITNESDPAAANGKV